jgi:uncharacterized protein YyaL (SSP411 family)
MPNRCRSLVPRAGLLVLTLALGGLFAARADEPNPPPLPKAGPEGAKPKPVNRLARETSPYLLMHAHNPVDWYPWGPEAFARAKKEDKPIFLSIGYSSCYWCHVMERQSFQNEEIAKLMNAWFVCVKVDREERPDVDALYMLALNAQGSRGGWPLSMFLTPDGKPIGGGTYWPPDDREVDGEKRYGFKTILQFVHNDWTDPDKRKELEKHADHLADAVNTLLERNTLRLVAVPLNRELVAEVVSAVKEEYDPIHGGFGASTRQWRGPKFPTPPLAELLLTEALRTGDKAVLKIVTHTLDRMAAGGLYDHLGGGFHRYTVDREWTIPHFEKMLYDNAQLVSLYSRAYAATKDPAYRRVVEETLAFVAREMTSPEGAFYSALDAESDHEEGKFYIWTAAEIDAALPRADAELFKKVYGVDRGPNFEGKANVLLLPKPLAAVASELKLTEEQLLARLRPIQQKLFDVRAKRTRPFLDTKIITSWNGLMIAGYADAAVALQNPAYAEAGERAAAFLLGHLRTKEGRLLRTYAGQPDGKPEAKLNAYLEDYALLVHGLLSLHDATGKKKWLDEAVALTETMITHHHDQARGGFFFTSHDHEKLFARAKDQYDGSTPSGNSIAALNFVRLARKTGAERYRKLAEETIKAFTAALKNNPAGSTAMARALTLWLDLKEQPAKPAGDDPFNPSGKPAPKPDDPVKLSATVTPAQPGPDGRQTITLVMEIAQGWHAYANPPGNDSVIPTTVTITAKHKPEEVKVNYPPGKELKDPDLGLKVFVYEGKTVIKVALRRPQVGGQPDASPLELSVRYQVCDDKRCLPPRTVKVPVGGK